MAGLGQGLTLVPFGDVDHWKSPRSLGCIEETRAPGLLDPCFLDARQIEGTFDRRPGLFQTAREHVYLSSLRPTLPLRRSGYGFSIHVVSKRILKPCNGSYPLTWFRCAWNSGRVATEGNIIFSTI